MDSQFVQRGVRLSALIALTVSIATTSAGQAPPSVSFVARMDFPVGQGPGQIATADFNSDGKSDLVTANFSSNDVSVLLGNGDGTFQPAVTYPVDTAPVLIIVADFNGDGKLDILTANEGSGSMCSVCSVSILLGNGDGTFQSQKLTSIAASAKTIAVGDFNGDGTLDLAFPTAVPQQGYSSLTVMLGNGDGTFQAPITANPGPFPTPPFVQAADFNKDGKLDLAASGGNSGGISVFLGNGDGTFQAAKTTLLTPTVFVEPFVVQDFTGDGNLDVLFGGADTFVAVGNGDGTFQPQMILSSTGGGGSPNPPIVADINGDGVPDLVIGGAYSGGTMVALGNGGGKFQPAVTVTGLPGTSAAVGDFNKDGKLDLATFNEDPGTLSGAASVALGYGDGTFQLDTVIDVASGLLASNGFILTGDFNGDGKADLLAVFDFLQVGGEFGVLLGNGDGTFQKQIMTGANACASGAGNILDCQAAAGDLNGDGKLDVVVTEGSSCAGGCSVGVFLGNGDGTFKPEVDYNGAGSSVALADFNGDGHLDIVTTGGSNNNISLLLGKGDGTFGFPTTIPTNGLANFVAVGDFNGDGKLDLAIVTGSDIAILLGNGDGTFGTEVDYPVPNCVWIAVGDFNGDGKLDLATANSSSNNVSVLLGNGDGTFGTATTYPVPNSATALAVGDFNGDGKIDLAVSNGPVSILLGNGDGTFQPAVNFGTRGGWRPVVADFNGDGSPDIAVTGISLLFNRRGLKTSLGLTNAGPTSITMPAGYTAHYHLAIGGRGFAGTATLTCTGAPKGADCSVPATVEVGAINASPFTVTVTTTSRTMATVVPNSILRPGWLWGVALVGIVFVWGSPNRGRRVAGISRCVPFVVLLFIASCGGGSGGGGTNPNGTPAGQYTLTVRATSGTLVQSLPLTLTVQ
jgi:hypothetical protein